MKRNLIFLFLLLYITTSLPTVVKAEEVKEDNSFKKVKYLKTVTYYNDYNIQSRNLLLSNRNSSITYEITEDEYNNAVEKNIINSNSSGNTETTYKKLTTTITNNGDYYRYTATLIWKNFPTVRSYDIIGIGFYTNLQPHSNINFIQEVCYVGGSCSSSNTGTRQIFNAGAGVSFKLPSGSLSLLKQTIYFDLEKKTTSTLVMQDAYGDYAHATSTISETNSQKYSVVGSSGIVLQSSIVNYYDAIEPAHAVWYGTW